MSAMPKTLFSFFAFIILSLSIVSPVSGQTVIQMEKDGGVYKIPCEINGLRLKLIFDTGASNVCISESIALMMLENGYLEYEDIKGSGSSIVADGRIVDNTRINIKSLKIGEITLNNVEAVVIHQQSAPLLLGQSAIQKLGIVSIVDSNLILDNHVLNSNVENTEYDIEKIENLRKAATDAVKNEFYELAISIYKELYDTKNLDLEGKLHYASCLRMVYRDADALVIYKNIEEEIHSSTSQMKRWAYYGMMLSYFMVKDYASSILYGQLTLAYADYDYDAYASIIYWLAASYIRMGYAYKAERLSINEINKYLEFKKYKATDCWKKKYQDEFLGIFYWVLSLSYGNIGENTNSIKYAIISAAWGYSEAIEWADNNNIDYSRKPVEYEY